MALFPSRDRSMVMLFSWPAIAAGLSVALGIHIVLTAFGLGIAFVQDQAENSSGGAATGFLIWSGIAWIVASFVGGYVTAWVADSSDYIEGVFHGLVLWGVLTFLVMFLPPSAIAGADSFIAHAVISSVAWFISIGGLLSLGSTVWGAVIGSHVVERLEARSSGTSRAA